MKATAIALACFILSALPLLAQTSTPEACGAPSVKFKVRTSKATAPAVPEPGRALVYFVQDDLHFHSTPKPLVREAIDGEWVGATHGNSYFALNVTPGEHHLCAAWQGHVVLTAHARRTAAAHFTAEEGKTYYFRIADFDNPDTGGADVQLSAMDSDEGLFLMQERPVSKAVSKQ